MEIVAFYLSVIFLIPRPPSVETLFTKHNSNGRHLYFRLVLKFRNICKGTICLLANKHCSLIEQIVLCEKRTTTKPYTFTKCPQTVVVFLEVI